MQQEGKIAEANAPSPYQNDATEPVTTPQPIPGVATSYAQPHHQPPHTAALQQPSIHPALTTVSYNVHHANQDPLTLVQSQPVARWYRQENIRDVPNVPDKMICSIINMLFFCFWLGVPAVILASQANSLRTRDPHKARARAYAAKVLNIAGIVIGIASIAFLFIWFYGVWGLRY